MRGYCRSIVLATMFSLGIFGCAVSSDTEPDDGDESGESAEPESIAEAEVDGICRRWFCNSVHPSECEGFGFGSSIGRCVVEARNNCTANCGPGCPLDDDPDCDDPF